jgi:hypothetical protein
MKRMLMVLAAATLALAQPDLPLEKELHQLIPLTTAMFEDDHPAVASRQGRIWVTWVGFSELDGTSRVFARSYADGKWSKTVEVSEKPGDYSKPAVAIDDAETVWVAWPAQVSGNWDIYARSLTGGVWAKTERLTNHPGPDVRPVMAAAKGRVILVWQSMRKGNLDILYRVHEAAWGEEGFVTENPANDWEPAVAATRDGAFHVAWDSFRGDYDVMLRTLRGSAWSQEMPVAASAKLENHASLAVDGRDRLWIAWEAGPEKWASDSANGGLRPSRDVGLACLQNGKLYRAADDEALRGIQAPAIAVGRDGKLRLFFRQPAGKNWLTVGTMVRTGGAWSKPEPLPYSEGRIDQRIVVADTGARIFACYPAGARHNVVYGRFYDVGPAAPVESLPKLEAAPAAALKSAAPAPARHTLRGYQLVWGDLHRHTDISEDGGIRDGSLLDTMRYSLDAAGLDFIGITDHTRYLPRRYNLWRIQQISDLLYKPGAFSPMHSYERSQLTPWGHRNVVHLNRNYTPVPASYDVGDMGVDPNGLFAALRGKNAISIPHTSAWGTKQVSWAYNDPDIERLVEVYQGCRSTYEYAGAPDPADRAVYEKDSPNFLWNALEKKIKLGLIASSDHGSTHMSFAAVYAKNVDRPSIFEGLKARRTYAATDKILVDFSIGETLMGGETTVKGKPELAVTIVGTGPIAQIDVIRNGKFAYATKPGTVRAGFTFRDEEYRGEDTFYYVRVIQQDKNMAWASPIWVKSR